MPLSTQPVLAAILVASGLGALAMCLLVLRYGFSAPAEEAPRARRRDLAIRLGHAFAGACFAATALLSVALLARAARAPDAPAASRAAAPGETLDRVVAERVAGLADRLAALESRMAAMEALVAPLDGRVAEIGARADRLATRLAPLAGVDGRVREVEALVRQHADGLARARARLEHLEAQPAPKASRPASAGPEKPESAPPASPSTRWVPVSRGSPMPAPSSEASASARGPVPTASGRAPDGATGGGSYDAPAPRGTHGGGGRQDGAQRGRELADALRDDWRTVRQGFAEAGDDLRSALDSLRRNLRETLGR